MKRNLKLKCATVLSLLSAMTSSYGATVVKGEGKDNDKPRLDMNMLVRARYMLFTSNDKEYFHNVSGNARLGGTFTYDFFNAALYADIGAVNVPGNTDTYVNNRTRLRKAYVGFDPLKTDDMTAGFKIGRIQPTSSTQWGPDYTTTYYEPPYGFGFADGVQGDVNYKLPNDQGDVSAQIWVVETTELGDRFGEAETGGVNSSGSIFALPRRSKRGVGGSVSANLNVGPGQVNVYAGTYYRGSDTSEESVTSSTKQATYLPEVSYTEGSVGYSLGDKIGGGAWFNVYNIEDAVTKDSGKQYLSYQVGGGVQGTSALFGRTGFLANDDVLTYSAAMTADVVYENENAYAIGSGLRPYLLTGAVGVGYKRGPMKFELDWANEYVSNSQAKMIESFNGGNFVQFGTKVYVVGEVAI